MHEEWLELIPFYIARRLSPDQARALERHLAQCKTCHNEFEEWRLLATVVRSEADIWSKQLPALSPKLREQLAHPRQNGYTTFDPSQTQVTHSKVIYAPTIQVNPKFSTRRPRSRLPITLAAAAVVMMVVAGVLALLLGQFGDKDETVEVPIQGLSSNEISSKESAVTPTTTKQPTATFTPYFINGTGLGGGFDGGEEGNPGSGGGSDSGNPLVGTPIPYTDGLGMTAPYATCTSSSATGSDVAVYNWPGLAFNIVDTLPVGEAWNTVVFSSDGWYEVVDPDDFSVGWVPGTQIHLNGDCSYLTLPSPTPANPRITSFTASTQLARPGSPITLTWQTQGAQRLWLVSAPGGVSSTDPAFSPDWVYDTLPLSGTLEFTLPANYARPSIQFMLLLDVYDFSTSVSSQIVLPVTTQ